MASISTRQHTARLFLELCYSGGVSNSYPGFAPIRSKNSILAPSASTYLSVAVQVWSHCSRQSAQQLSTVSQQRTSEVAGGLPVASPLLQCDQRDLRLTIM